MSGSAVGDTQEEVVRRVVAVVDSSTTHSFCGDFEVPPGTEFRLDGRRVFMDGPDLVVAVSEAWHMRLASGCFHLELEEEVRSLRIDRRRRVILP